jgi:hypothetical protein
MYCKNCGKQNDDDSKFCMYCGKELNQSSNKSSIPKLESVSTTMSASETADNINNPAIQKIQPQNYNTADTGYFLIVLFTFINIGAWFVWNQTNDSGGVFSSSYRQTYLAVRVLNVLMGIGEFIIAFIYVKKPMFKLFIAVAGILCSAYFIFYWIKEFAAGTI